MVILLKIKQFVVIVTIIFLASCKEKAVSITQIAASQMAIDASYQSADSLENFIAPYRERMGQVMDSTLAYAPKTLTKEDGGLNTSAGNLMADIILEQSNPVFHSRTGQNVDFVVMNHGGIRAPISKGKVTTRTAFEVMPFENNITVVELSGSAVRELVYFLINAKRPHPIGGLQIVLDKSGDLESISIQGEPFDEDRNYFVATSNYLVQGGDNMGFFKDGLSFTEIDYLIRNAMIDYFKKADTLKATVDDRFIKLKV